MNPDFPFRPPFQYPKFDAVTFDDGIRVYMTPAGPAPSVTTILGTLPKPGIDAWRERVGEQEAKRITKEATDIGSLTHDLLEGYVSAYLKGTPYKPPETEYEHLAHRMAGFIKRFALPDLSEVWAIEEALHCHNLYAGRCDLIGVFADKPSIIDYKTSRHPKPVEYIYSYKLQIAAYAVAHREMFGEDGITQGVILIAIRPDLRNTTFIQRFILKEDELNELKIKWMEVVEEFHHKLAAQEV